MAEDSKPKSLERTPGPNKYMLPTLLGKDNHDPRKRIEPAFSIQGRRRPDKVNLQPGPDKFQTAGLTRYGNEASGKIEPSMKGKIPPVKVRPTPGPGKYDSAGANLLTLSQAPAYTLGGRIKTVLPTAHVPGPKYQLPTYIDGTGYMPIANGSPAFKLHDRLPELGTHDKIPGPLAYGATPLETYKSKNAPQMTMAGRTSRKEPNTGGPGPNKYNSLIYPIGKSGPAFSLSSRHRPRVGVLRTKADNAPAYIICDSG